MKWVDAKVEVMVGVDVCGVEAEMGTDVFGGYVTCVESGMVWRCWLMFKCESERSMLCLEGVWNDDFIRNGSGG